MKVCEIEGSIKGFEFSSKNGFLFNGEWIRTYDYVYVKEDIQFPYSCGDPKKINLDKVINKKFILTVEVIEDEQEKKEK